MTLNYRTVCRMFLLDLSYKNGCRLLKHLNELLSTTTADD